MMLTSRLRMVTGAAVVMIVLSVGIGAQQPAHAPQLNLPGEIALLTVEIKPDQTVAFEKVMTRVREALMKSPDVKRHRQAAGWKVMKIDKPLPDGNIAYVHIINPVVPQVDYAVMQILYEAFPEERQTLYESYRAAFAANLSLATGAVAVDLATQLDPPAASR